MNRIANLVYFANI